MATPASLALRLDVTADDIRAGDPGHANDCAIARAARRAYPGRTVSVGPEALTLSDPDTVFRYPLPREIQDWIRAFDNGRPVEPFAADLLSVQTWQPSNFGKGTV